VPRPASPSGTGGEQFPQVPRLYGRYTRWLPRSAGPRLRHLPLPTPRQGLRHLGPATINDQYGMSQGLYRSISPAPTLEPRRRYGCTRDRPLSAAGNLFAFTEDAPRRLPNRHRGQQSPAPTVLHPQKGRLCQPAPECNPEHDSVSACIFIRFARRVGLREFEPSFCLPLRRQHSTSQAVA